LPKERLQELAERGEISDEELELSEAEREKRLRDYVKQPLYPVLEIIESVDHKKIVVLGDPGAGKSSLLQYLALDWAETEPRDRLNFPLPLLVELRIYVRDKEEKNVMIFSNFFIGEIYFVT
jgi:predicted NACHT family NTPase